MKGIDVIVEQAGSRYQVAVVRVLGQIDTTTSHELERRLQYLLKDQQFEIAIDLSKVNYISSAGWGIFISEIRGIRESGGDLKLAGMTPEVAEVFELLEFHNILESYRTVEGAVEKFEGNRIRQGSQAAQSGGSGGTGEDVSDVIPAAAPGTSGERDEAAAESNRSDAGGAMSDAGNVRDTRAAMVHAETVSPSAEGAEGAHSKRASAVPAKEAGVGQSMKAAGTAVLAEAPETRSSAAGVPRMEAQATASVRPASKSLDSMICEIVKENPEHGCLKIRKELSERGYRKQLSPLAVFAQLKRLNLETKEKRKQYAESGQAGESGK
jgi:anti-sigma B factor antagonist